MGDPDEMPEWIDRTLPADGTGKTVTPKEILMAAARMQRDGRSLRYIRHELELDALDSKHGKFISDRVLQRALNEGHRYLNEAIARGEEPAESRVRRYPDGTNEDLWLPDRDFKQFDA